LDERAASSRAAAKTLLEALQATVTEAAQSKGPVHAIAVCNEQALPITHRVSQELGIDVGRTSHKLRNPKNAPDAWEKGVLEDFAQRKAAGEDLTKMEFYEVIEQDGKKTFRYMKAIPLGAVCFNCHGTRLRPEVAAKLDELYPQDEARGFNVGDLRGAFTIKQDM
jgi:hypothetical protein